MGRKRNIRCPAKSMDTPPLAASTPTPTVASTLLPLAAPVLSPVVPHMTFPPSPMPCASVSSEGSCSTKSSGARSKKNKQNPSKKDDLSRTKRKNHVVIQDELLTKYEPHQQILTHLETHASENGAPSDVISIMPVGPTEDILEAIDDDERTSEFQEQVSVEGHGRIRSVGLRSGPNHVCESLSSGTQLSQLSYERLREKYEKTRAKMEAKLQAQQHAFDTWTREMKERFEETRAKTEAMVQAHQHALDTKMKEAQREFDAQLKRSLAAMLTSQGVGLPPIVMPTPVSTTHLEIPTQHDLPPSNMHKS